MCPWCKRLLALKRFGRIGRGMYCKICNLWFAPFDITLEQRSN